MNRLTFSQRSEDMLREVVYTPESQVRHPRRLLAEMWYDLCSSRELAWRLVVRDISALYRQSLLGLLWAFLPPIVTALIFIILHQQEVFTVRETSIPYPAFVLVGTVLWQVFVDSINAPLRSVIAAKPMLAKIKFPYEALILSAMGQVLFNLGIKLVILAVVFIVFSILSRVVFPAPFGPIKPSASPRLSSKDTPFTAQNSAFRSAACPFRPPRSSDTRS